MFKRSACGQDADNHPVGQGSSRLQPEPLIAAGLRGGMVIAATL
jgi:hypothetical protein